MSKTLELPSKMIVPTGWTLRELGDLFEFKNGVNAGKESYGIGTKFINVMEIIYNEMITSDMIKGSVQITKEQIKLYAVKDGDIIFNRTSETTNEIGLSSVYFGDEDVVFGGFVIRATPLNNDLNRFFKKYCLRSNLVRNQIIKGGQGVVRSNIGQGDLSKIKLLVPPYNEQEKIAKILGSIDDAINITTKLISKKEKNKKWLMQQLLTGKKRLKGFENRSWSYLSFSDIYRKIKIKAGTERLIILSVTKNGIVLQNEYFNKEIASEDTSNYLVMKKGDMVLSGLNFWMGSIDTLTEFEKGMVSPAYKVYEIINDDISESYMKFFVRSRLMLQALIGSSVVGASVVRRNMDTETLHEWPFYLPHINEQNAIANILTSVDKEIKLLKEKVEKLKEQKKGLMQVLLTGKKRLK